MRPLPVSPSRLVALAAAAVLASGCASFQPSRVAVGQDEAAVRAVLGPPTGRYPLDAGAQRLEYARGPFGRETWMVDLNESGRVTGVAQVLNAHHFAQVRPGMVREQVLRLLGRPGAGQREYMDRETWSWRFENPFCLRAQVTFAADGRVVDGVAQGMDPMCTPDL